MIEEWFRSTQEYKSQKKGRDQALKDQQRVWNMDETAFPLDSRAGKVRPILIQQGTKNIYAIKQGDKMQITVVGCCNAMGDL